MKSKKYIYTFFIIIFLFSCKTSKEASKNEGNDITVTVTEDEPNKVSPVDRTVSLADHLRKLSGVVVRGSGSDAMVYVRSGASSLTQSGEPLYVVNGQPFNGGFQDLSNAIDVNLIHSIQVLKNASDTSFYGMRGANGVILIKLKN